MKKQGSEEAERKKSSQIYNLDPYIDEDGTIRVGGRLNKSNLNNECKHLIVLPKGSPISKLIIAWCHNKTGHAGRGMIFNKIWTSGFWIVCANSATRNLYITVLYAEVWEGNLGNKKWQNCDLIDSKRNFHSLIVGLICLSLSLSAANQRNQNTMES